MRETGAPPRPRPDVMGLQPYRVPESAPVKLNQNESPFDWPPRVKEEVLGRLGARMWNRYPSIDAEPLRRALARASGVGADMIAVTNGSNEAWLALVAAYAAGREVVLPVPTYSMAPRLAIAGGAAVKPVLLRPDFTLDLDAMSRDGVLGAPLIFLASPNNPTGRAYDRGAVETILTGAAGLVVVDEAYAGFGAESWLPAVPRHPNLVVLRTFSKAFALAGARVGWMVGNEAVIAAVRNVLPPYNLNLFAQDAALVMLEHQDLVRAQAERIISERERIRAALAQIPGVVPYPSAANFLLFGTVLSPAVLDERLRQRGVLVRDVSAAPLLGRCLRVTVGTPEENDRFLAALAASLAEP